MVKPKLHPVTELLLKRMESHPEEFPTLGSGRWGSIVNELMSLVPTEEWDYLQTKFKEVRLQELHATVSQRLLVGEEEEKKPTAPPAWHSYPSLGTTTYTNPVITTSSGGWPTTTIAPKNYDLSWNHIPDFSTDEINDIKELLDERRNSKK